MTPQEERWKAVGQFIKNQREVAGMSIRRLSDLAKVSNPYLSQIERGIYKPSAEVLKAIAGALQIQSETLFARAGFLDEETEHGPSGVERAIKNDPRLSAEHKRALIGVYRSFISQDQAAVPADAAKPQAARPPKQGKQKTKQST
jgi:transcriptional regulator with XRE-family HTH domain